MKVTLERINQDYLFKVTSSNGRSVLLDNKSKKEGKVAVISPMELLLMGLAGCSSIDVIAILNKQKLNPTSLKMEVDGERNENEIPSLFNKINLKVIVDGEISPKKIRRAVELTFDKYCSISKTLEHTAEINYLIFLNGIEI